MDSTASQGGVPPLSTMNASLTPGPGLEALADGPPNAWRTATGDCWFTLSQSLPAGWLRLRLSLRRLDRGKPDWEHGELHVDFGAGFDEQRPLERLIWKQALTDDLFLYLARPAQALRFRPLKTAGDFVLEEFALESLTRWQALGSALAHKWRLLRAYRCTTRVLLRGLGLFLTLRWKELSRRVFKGLLDLRRLRPENDGSLEAYTAWWRRRGLTDMDREQLRAEAAALVPPPDLSIILPVNNTSDQGLRLVIESFRRQIYQHWRLVVGVTPYTNFETRLLLDRYAATDSRIRIIVGPRRQDFAPTGNAALDAVDATHVAIVNPGYELAEFALLRLAQQLHQHPEATAILNRTPPNPVHRSLDDRAELFRAGAGGSQLNVFRKDELFKLGGFPADPECKQPGTELGRQFFHGQIHYLADNLTYPTTNIAPVQVIKGSGFNREASAPSSPPVPSLLITGNIVGISGYDYLVFEMARGLLSLGVDVRLNAERQYRAELLPPYFAPLFRPRRPGEREMVIGPPHLLEQYAVPPGGAIFTMWESDYLEPRWVAILNQAALVIVPSQWGIDCFRANGVTAPLVKAPLGLDPLTFHPRASKPSCCTFGTAAALWEGGVRKNTQAIVDAFARAFPEENDVRLRIKLTPRCEFPEPPDPRIEVLRQFLTPADLAEWYRSLTCLVNASYAEGFGLHLVEALACGVPIISTSYSAVTEYFDEAVGFPVSHRQMPADSGVYRGFWGEPEEDSLVQAMRAVYEDEREAARRGARGAARMRRFTWKDTGRRVVMALTM